MRDVLDLCNDSSVEVVVLCNEYRLYSIRGIEYCMSDVFVSLVFSLLYLQMVVPFFFFQLFIQFVPIILCKICTCSCVRLKTNFLIFFSLLKLQLCSRLWNMATSKKPKRFWNHPMWTLTGTCFTISSFNNVLL